MAEIMALEVDDRLRATSVNTQYRLHSDMTFEPLPELCERALAAMRAARVSPMDAACHHDALAQGWGPVSGCPCGGVDAGGGVLRATWSHLVFECQSEEVVGPRETYMEVLHRCLDCVDDAQGESWVEVRRVALAFEQHFCNGSPWPGGSTFEDVYPVGGAERDVRRVLGGLFHPPKLGQGRSVAGFREDARRAALAGAGLVRACIGVVAPLLRDAQAAARARLLARTWGGVWRHQTWGRGPSHLVDRGAAWLGLWWRGSTGGPLAVRWLPRCQRRVPSGAEALALWKIV